MGPVTTTDPVVRLVIRFRKYGSARYIGHLDLVRNFQRAARRAEVPIAYSQGFNPHPRLTFASPLPVGACGWEELAAFDLYQYMEPKEFLARMNPALPDGVEITDAFSTKSAKGTFGVVLESRWEIACQCENSDRKKLEDAISKLIASSEVFAPGPNGIDREIRQRINDIRIESFGGTEATLLITLTQEKDKSARPQDVIRALEQSVGGLVMTQVHRRNLVCPKLDLESDPRPLADSGTLAPPDQPTPGRREVI